MERQMKLNLFEYVVLLNPRSEKEETSMIVKQTSVLAKDAKTAAMLAARSIPEKHLKNIDQCEVIVRPF